ncbi:abscisic acid receptor PYL4-like [Andrographis paniculata]|uniref:abscisic acid receptor PYL4-like n=1 Tax=Andrographis paniculata TaxID=175694 RepID=UPI0021E834B2|nr:abscisic acid receptor PYL4-like [Andrographis paniculata]
MQLAPENFNSPIYLYMYRRGCVGRVVTVIAIGFWRNLRRKTMPSSVQIRRIDVITGGGGGVRQKQQSKPIWYCPVSDEDRSVPENVVRRHTHAVAENQCCSAVVRTIDASVDAVWSVVRRFDKPQAYKHFVKSCDVIVGDGDVGTLREVRVVSGLPAGKSTERLEILDDAEHVMSFSVVGGDHRLHNYRSVTTLHAAEGRSGGTVVVESYVVDTPAGNTPEETCAFVDTIVRCNLQSLAQIAEKFRVN